MPTKPPITNEDIMNVLQTFMQQTSDNFVALCGRMDGLESRMDRFESRMDQLENRMGQLESRMDRIEIEVKSIKTTLHEHSLQLSGLRQTVDRLENGQKAYTNDIADLLDRVSALEARTA